MLDQITLKTKISIYVIRGNYGKSNCFTCVTMCNYKIRCFLSNKSSKADFLIEFSNFKCCTIKCTWMINWWLYDIVCNNTCMESRMTMMWMRFYTTPVSLFTCWSIHYIWVSINIKWRLLSCCTVIRYCCHTVEKVYLYCYIYCELKVHSFYYS